MTGKRIEPSVPWTPARSAEDPVPEVDVDRLFVFVPAIMSVGLLFSLTTLLRDLFHWTGTRARDRRTSIKAGAVVGVVVGDDESRPEEIGLLSRPLYLISAIVLVTGAIYISIGSTANYLRDNGYLRDIGWLLAISLGLAAVLGFLAVVAITLFATWPKPPPWTLGPLRTAPLSVTPERAGQGPSWSLSAATVAAAVATGMLSLIVGSARRVALGIDEPIAGWLVDIDWLDRLAVVDPFGRTLVSIALVALIGLAGFRCRVMALAYPIAFLIGWLGGEVIRAIVERPRPIELDDFGSFPSGHLVQAVFIAGLLPLALRALLSDRRAATLARTVLGSAAVATGLYRIHTQDHWPLDVLAGMAFGLTVVLATHWTIEHRSWHRACSSCPWSADPAPTPWRRGVFVLPPRTSRLVGLAGVGLAVVAAAVLAVATLTFGLPQDPEGSGLGSAISGPVQIGLAALMAIAGLVALRWKATAALLMAVAASGVGLFASIQYRPWLTVGLTAALLVPAVLTWLAWQRNETIGRIATLAAVTTTLLTMNALGSIEIYQYFFGPTHPDSTAPPPAWEEADWLWLGGVGPRSATVVAGGIDDGPTAELQFRPLDGGRPVRTVEAPVDDYGLARFVLDGLEPDTRYGYAVLDDDQPVPESWRSDAEFRTFADSPQDLVVALASCARSGSNGAVFDAIVAEDPDLYLALGDLHYGNQDSTDPADHIAQYARSLSQPGQAALFSSVPTAYVWDDHDYGPNDSDGSAVSRNAVSRAYRRAVPSQGVDPDPEASIAQAFTVGRVRFVLSDTRSRRSADSILGPTQQRWLIEELTASSKSHALVVWANPSPWIGPPRPGADAWSGFADDRRAIADALIAADVTNLVMVSGDAHMVAIDDGTNSGYATDGSPGFPVLHAAALDRPGSVKGGPYSHGTFPGAGQYGKLVVSDDGGSTIAVRLSGHHWADGELVALDLTFDVPPAAVG